MDFSQITEHPDAEDIISKLVLGDNPKDIAQWLKAKYPEKEQKHLHLSSKALQEYINKHLDLTSHIKNDMEVAKNFSLSEGEKLPSASLLKNKTYRERMLEYVNTEIDLKQMIKELVFLCRDRMEQVFDKIQDNPTQTKADYILIHYFDTLGNLLDRCDKIVNNAPDQIIQHNVTVQLLDQHIAAFQEAFRRTLAKVDPETSMLFMDELTQELSKLKSPENNGSTLEGRLLEAQILKEMIKTNDK